MSYHSLHRRCNVYNFLEDESNIDIKYIVDHQVALAGWDNGDESGYQRDNIQDYKDTKTKPRMHWKPWNPWKPWKPWKLNRQKKRGNVDVSQLKDDIDILDFDEEQNAYSDDEDCYVIEEAKENLSKGHKCTLKDFMGTRNTLRVKTSDHGVEDPHFQYSKNHASSEIIACFPKKNVIPEVPEMHKLLDEIYIQPISEEIVAPATSIVPATYASIKKTRENKPSQRNSSVNVFSLEISEFSMGQEILEREFGNAYVEGKAYPTCFAIFVNQLNKAVPRNDNMVFVVEGRNELTTATESIKTVGIPVQLKVFNAKPETLEFLINETKSKDPVDFINVVHRVLEVTSTENDVINMRDDRYTPVPQVVEKFIKWKTKPVTVSEAFDLVFDNVAHHGEKPTDSVMPSISCVDTEELFCLICYTELLTPSPSDFGCTEAYLRPDKGATLLLCRHWFCRSCWQQYLDEKMSQNATKIECPYTDCKNIVDIVTCLSFSSHSNAVVYLQTKFESEVQNSSSLEWCPGCESAVVCENFTKKKTESILKDIPFVSCSCKMKWCFSCQSNPHWPASCELYREYQEIRKQQMGILFDRTGQPYQTEVEMKPCPYCKTPINKNQGCNFMACRCGKSFCWNCGQLFSQHQNTCVTKKVTTRVFTSLEAFSDSPWSSPVSKAVGYQLQIRKFWKIRTKLGLEKGRTPGSEPPSDNTKVGLLRKAFEILKEWFSILECVALAMRRTAKSKNFNRRIAMFLTRIDFLLTNFNMTLSVKKLQQINYAKLSFLIKAAQESMLNLQKFGLSV